MPYIEDAARRSEINTTALFEQKLKTPGELAYAFSQLVDGYAFQHGRRYQTFAEVVGALETLKLEYYRDVIGPYEATKKIENGGVW